MELHDVELALGPDDQEKVFELINVIFRKASQAIKPTSLRNLRNCMRKPPPKCQVVIVPQSKYNELFSVCLKEFSDQVDSLFYVLEPKTISSSSSSSSSTDRVSAWDSGIRASVKFLELTNKTQDSIKSFFNMANNFQKFKDEPLVSISIKKFEMVMEELESLLEVWKGLVVGYETYFYAVQIFPDQARSSDFYRWTEVMFQTSHCITQTNYLMDITDKSRYNYFLSKARFCRNWTDKCVDDLEALLERSKATEHLTGRLLVESIRIQRTQIAEDEDGDFDYEEYIFSQKEKNWIKLALRIFQMIRLFADKASPIDRYQLRIFRKISNDQYNDLNNEFELWMDYSKDLTHSLSYGATSHREMILKVFKDFESSFQRASRIIGAPNPNSSSERKKKTLENELVDHFKSLKLTKKPIKKRSVGKVSCFGLDTNVDDQKLEENEKNWVKVWAVTTGKISKAFASIS